MVEKEVVEAAGDAAGALTEEGEVHQGGEEGAAAGAGEGAGAGAQEEAAGVRHTGA